MIWFHRYQTCSEWWESVFLQGQSY